jgi:hypothetical protein
MNLPPSEGGRVAHISLTSFMKYNLKLKHLTKLNKRSKNSKKDKNIPPPNAFGRVRGIFMNSILEQ